MLNPEQTEEFMTRGFVRVPGAFAREDAARMEARIWAVLGRKHGVRREDPSTWDLPLAVGLQALRTDPVFEPMSREPLSEAVDSILGHERWLRPKHWGSILVTFPNRGAAWNVPSRIWHTDYPFFLPLDRIYGVLLLTFVGEVPAASGGTVVVEGSPAIVRRFLETHPKHRNPKTKMKVVRQALMRSDPWLTELATLPDDDPNRITRFMEMESLIDGLPVRVTELTGEPGDIILGHPWLLHAPAPNCGAGPRFMRVQRLRRAH